jgi:uncharacterized membrane protein
MVALHPPLSGFPLAFISLLLAMEVLGLTRFARLVQGCKGVVIGATMLSTAASFFSGYQAVSNLGDLSDVTERLISEHHIIGRLLLFNVIALATSYWIARVAAHGKRFFFLMYYIFLVSQTVLTVWAGYLGGGLVFNHGVGVKG